MAVITTISNRKVRAYNTKSCGEKDMGEWEQGGKGHAIIRKQVSLQTSSTGRPLPHENPTLQQGNNRSTAGQHRHWRVTMAVPVQY